MKNNCTTGTCYPSNTLVPSRLFNLAESLFGPLGVSESSRATTWSPSVDITESKDSYQVRAELPDVKNEDLKVAVKEGVLTIHGERKFEKVSDTDKVHLVERSYGHFTRSFTLPKDAAADSVKAEYKNGLLSLTIPKREEVKPKEVQIAIG